MSENITADEIRLRNILSENGLPTKLGVKLNYKEYQLHNVLCKAYNFTSGLVELEVPEHILTKLGENFLKIWAYKATSRKQGKLVVLFKITPEAIKVTLKTALTQDKGIFNTKVNPVPLHLSWAKYINLPSGTDNKNVSVDWSKAQMHAERLNNYTKQQINDGKTFNAQKDNPWARKNLKNKQD